METGKSGLYRLHVPNHLWLWPCMIVFLPETDIGSLLPNAGTPQNCWVGYSLGGCYM